MFGLHSGRSTGSMSRHGRRRQELWLCGTFELGSTGGVNRNVNHIHAILIVQKLVTFQLVMHWSCRNTDTHTHTNTDTLHSRELCLVHASVCGPLPRASGSWSLLWPRAASSGNKNGTQPIMSLKKMIVRRDNTFARHIQILI